MDIYKSLTFNDEQASAIYIKYSQIIYHSEKDNETRIIKTFSIKMKEDVGTSRPKKYVNKVGRLT